MGSYTSKPKSKKVEHTYEITAIDRAILDLKNARDRLRRYQIQLEKDLMKLTSRALAFKKQNKQTAAIHVLKLRQFKQREAQNVDNQLLNVHEMISTLNTKVDEAKILDALKQGTQALKTLHEETSVDDVLKIMDEMQEEMEIEEEISNIIASGGSSVSIDDDEDILQELEAMERELNAADTVPDNLPVAPDKQLPAIEKKTEEVAQTNERVAVAS